jgi:Na+/melibiose symporter-like transporter
MFGKNKKKKYDKNEVESIMGIAISLKEKKGEEYKDEDFEKIKRTGLDKKSIINKAEKYNSEGKKKPTTKYDERKQKAKKKMKDKKEKRNKTKMILYLIYFIVWVILLIALLIPYFIMDNSGSNEGFEWLWLFIMIGTSIIGLITGIFIEELEGIIGGFLIGLLMGLGLYFFLKLEIGRIISIIVLSLIALLLFFLVFKRKFDTMVKR